MKSFVFVGAMLALVSGASTVMAEQGTPTGTVDGNQSFSIPAGAGAAVGAGLVVMGASRGIGSIGSSATESIARQPEAGGQVFTAMLLSAALIEGIALFGVVVALLIALK